MGVFMKEKDEAYDEINVADLIANLNDSYKNNENKDLTNAIDAVIKFCNFIGDYSFCWECPLKHICYKKENNR